ncbi:MAG: alpha/beta fold hydrolase, partial [Steroidobacteraceae bacterium]
PLPGHGTAPASHDPAGYADLAGAVGHRLPQGSFDAVGFSLGAKIALEIAVRSPARIRRLVLGGLGDNVFAPESIAEAAARALESGPTADTPPAVLAFLSTWEPDQNDPAAVAAVLRRPSNPLLTADRLGRIVAPVLLVNGAEDPVGRHRDRLVSSLKHVCCIDLPGVNHFGLPRAPAFLRHALEFLRTEEEVP